LSVYSAIKNAADCARQGLGPTLVEAITYRWRGHSKSDRQAYRTRDEVKEWQQRDPIPRFRERLTADGAVSAVELDEIEGEVERTIDEAIAFGEASPAPEPADLYTDVFVEAHPREKE
jgi:TPP-dependent pyruvate/acetoin dehydrogenase alpha subunit